MNEANDNSKKIWIRKHLRCPVCKFGELDHTDNKIDCLGCNTTFRRGRNGSPVMMTAEMEEKFNIEPTENVSAMGYDPEMTALIEQVSIKGGTVLDCGAGFKKDFYPHVINVEIVEYPSTDVLAVGQSLPFHDDSFEAALSIAVLEHVNDPFACARELVRVLKPGGKLLCAVPFLQPEHGYPHHYFNMTRLGLRQLFEGQGTIVRQEVPRVLHPVFAISWILTQYATHLPPAARKQFRRMKMSEFIDKDPHYWLGKKVVTDLSEDALWQLACGTLLELEK